MHTNTPYLSFFLFVRFLSLLFVSLILFQFHSCLLNTISLSLSISYSLFSSQKFHVLLIKKCCLCLTCIKWFENKRIKSKQVVLYLSQKRKSHFISILLLIESSLLYF
jgi:hypothetical protein